jgi:serine O-acetyltransferase
LKSYIKGLQMLKKTIKKIQSDLFRYTGELSFKYFVKEYFFNPAFKYLFYFRLASSIGGLPVIGWVVRFKLILLSYKFHYQLPRQTTVGFGLYFGHYGPIIINPRAKIGNNVNIAAGVVIGQTNRGKLKGAPVIGNRVWIGANSVIVGAVTIGDDSLIAPLSYVNFDVPANSLVMGNPGKVVKRDIDTQYYVSNQWGFPNKNV